MSITKTAFIWWPIRLVRLSSIPFEHSSLPRIEVIGWLWLKKAVIRKNINHGWLAFLDDFDIKESYENDVQIGDTELRALYSAYVMSKQSAKTKTGLRVCLQLDDVFTKSIIDKFPDIHQTGFNSKPIKCYLL